MVRIWEQEGKLHARAVRLKKANNNNPAEITDDRTVVLDGELPEEIRSLLTGGEAWEPSNENEQGLAGFDGARWIFELRDQAGYHMLDLWSPDNARPSDEMLESAGFEPAKIRDFRPYVTAGKLLLKLMGLGAEEFQQ